MSRDQPDMGLDGIPEIRPPCVELLRLEPAEPGESDAEPKRPMGSRNRLCGPERRLLNKTLRPITSSDRQANCLTLVRANPLTRSPAAGIPLPLPLRAPMASRFAEPGFACRCGDPGGRSPAPSHSISIGAVLSIPAHCLGGVRLEPPRTLDAIAANGGRLQIVRSGHRQLIQPARRLEVLNPAPPQNHRLVARGSCPCPDRPAARTSQKSCSFPSRRSHKGTPASRQSRLTKLW